LNDAQRAWVENLREQGVQARVLIDPEDGQANLAIIVRAAGPSTEAEATPVDQQPEPRATASEPPTDTYRFTPSGRSREAGAARGALPVTLKR